MTKVSCHFTMSILKKPLCLVFISLEHYNVKFNSLKCSSRKLLDFFEDLEEEYPEDTF